MDGANNLSIAKCLLAAGLLWLAFLAQAWAVEAVEPTALALKNPVTKTALEPSLLYSCPGYRVDDLDAARNLAYHPLSNERISFGYQAYSCWFRFRLANSSAEPLALVLGIDFAVLDHVRLFMLEGERVKVLIAGSAEPYADRSLQMSSIGFPLHLAAWQAQDYYLQVETHTPFVVPVSISDGTAFTESRIDRQWWQGIFFGIGIGLFFYNLFLWLRTREKFYGYYLAHLSFALLFFSTIQGVSYPWWPGWPDWNSRAPHVFIFCFLCAGTLFTREFLAAWQWPRLDRLIKAVVCLFIVGAIANIFLPLDYISHFLPALILLDMPLLLYVGVKGWRAGQAQAPIFLLAWGIFLLTEMIAALASYGFLFRLDIALRVMQAGFSAQLVLLSLALANRINTLNNERLLHEKEIMRARAENTAKSDFLATMSHEIRTPMNAVLGISQLLAVSRLNPEQRRHIEMLQGAGKSLLAIINSVLDYSKISAGHMRLDHVDFRLRDLLDECFGMVTVTAMEKSLIMRAEIDENMPEWVRGDAGHLRQVLLNLLGNAVKFTGQGHVLLRASSMPGKTAQDFYLSVQVEDSGIGLNVADSERLFQAFNQADSSVTRNYGGTGLGLAISRQLVEMMDGRIGVRSTPGHGATFWFTVLLQKIDAPHVIANSSARADQSPLAGLRVLVAEDNAVNQLVIAGLLNVLGINSVMCGNGREVLSLLEGGAVFDLVLMDCEMPVMDGYEAARRVRAREKALGLPPLPIIALTAHALPEHRERCLAAGMSDHLPKPLSLPILEAVLRRWHAVA